MFYQQMYYTSCEKGMSGYAGYQFNAATPGTPDEILRKVEALTAYEAPRSVGHAPTEADIEACPVNLCFSPDGDVTAQVVFVGEDYSGRLGNYFAHAVSGKFDRTLPIELWRSSVWARRTVDGTDLPVLPGPLPSGPITRPAVDAFLESSGLLRLLPALLAAVERAVTSGDRSVVIYERDADRIAHWIAAVSYMLPPAMIRDMSFATYQHRPGRARQHVMGTVPGADFAVNEGAFESYYLFDFIDGRASRVPDQPLADRLAGNGAVEAEQMWLAATPLAAGTERTLDDWRPVMLAAAVLAGVPLDPVEAEPMVGWLGGAAQLPAASWERLARLVLGLPDAPPALLSRLAAAAEAVGAQGVLGDSEILLVKGRLEDEEAAVPLRSRVGRENAERAYMQALGGADAAGTARLARTAARYGVRLGLSALHDRGREAVGPALLADPADPLLVELLSEQSQIRAGTLEYLGMLTSDQAVDAFGRGLDRVFSAEELKTRPVLHDALLITAARRGEGDRIEVLLQSVTEADVLPLPLLNALWPDLWTAAEAAETLRRSSAKIPSGWIEPLIGRPAVEPAEGLAELVAVLEPRRIAGRMAPQSRERLDSLRYVAEKEEFFRSGSDKEKKTAAVLLAKSYDSKGKHARDYLDLRLSAAALSLHPKIVFVVLLEMPEVLRDGYLRTLRRVLDPRVETAHSRERAAAVAFAVTVIARHENVDILAKRINKVLAESLPLWPKRDLKKVGGRVKEYGSDHARAFDCWREEHERRGLLSWLVRR
jgi:hypothetical protein